MPAYKQPETFSASPLGFMHKFANLLANTLTNKESFAAYFEPFIQLFKPEWRYQQLAAKVISKRNENNKIYTLTLKPSASWSGFKAGQFVLFSIEINGRLLTRTFSISSAPAEFEQSGLIELSICEQDQGAVTPWLKAELNTGDFVYLSQAMGDFCLNLQDKKVFIAAGSGITPIRSMLKQAKNEAWLKDAHLFFYQRNPEETIFLDDLAALKQARLNIHLLYTELDGHFSLEHLKTGLKLEQTPDATFFNHTEAYICGPGKMIASCREQLNQAGLADSNIHYEYFGRAPSSRSLTESLAADADEFIQVDYLDSNKQVQFTSGTVSKTLLELAEEQGLKPVSGCRMGICHQCICHKKQGRVFNTKTGEISDSGPEAIQLCLSVPVGSVELEL